MCTCDEALELISARLDGVITPEEEELLEEHLSACPACRDLLADLEGVHEAMPGLWVEPPADLKDRIMDRIRSDNVTPLPVRPARKVRWKGWAALAAVCAVALLGAGSLRYLNLNLAGSSSTGAAAPMEAAADAAAAQEAGASAGAGADSYAPSSAPEGGDATQFTASDGAANGAAAGGSAPQLYDSGETESTGESRMTEEAAPAATAAPQESGSAFMTAAAPEYTALERAYEALGGAGSYAAQDLPNPSVTGLLLSRAEGAPDGTPARAVLVYVGTETADGGETRWIFHLHPLGEAGGVDPAAGYTLCTVSSDGTAEVQAVTPADGASCGNEGCAAALEEG